MGIRYYYLPKATRNCGEKSRASKSSAPTPSPCETVASIQHKRPIQLDNFKCPKKKTPNHLITDYSHIHDQNTQVHVHIDTFVYVCIGYLKIRWERGFLPETRKGERAALASDANLAAAFRTEGDRKTDLAAALAMAERENIVSIWFSYRVLEWSGVEEVCVCVLGFCVVVGIEDD